MSIPSPEPSTAAISRALVEHYATTRDGMTIGDLAALFRMRRERIEPLARALTSAPIPLATELRASRIGRPATIFLPTRWAIVRVHLDGEQALTLAVARRVHAADLVPGRLDAPADLERAAQALPGLMAGHPRTALMAALLEDARVERWPQLVAAHLSTLATLDDIEAGLAP